MATAPPAGTMSAAWAAMRAQINTDGLTLTGRIQRLAAAGLTAAAQHLAPQNRPRVEVVAYINFAANDEAVTIAAFVDGVEMPVDKVVVDPSCGHHIDDWRARGTRAVAGASPACAELITEWFEDGEGHVNVNADRPIVGVA